jgi:hypothetical protein
MADLNPASPWKVADPNQTSRLKAADSNPARPSRVADPHAAVPREGGVR